MIPSPQRVVTVDVRPRPYRVLIGPGTLGGLGQHLREHVQGPPNAKERVCRGPQTQTNAFGGPGPLQRRRVVVVTDENVGPLYASAVLESLRRARFEPECVTVPAGEGSKSLACVSRLYDALADAHMDRGSPLVALGGGVVGDLTGFVAATWLRGVPFVQCPTTVEADVDSSVGGKTGVNHFSGKNMIGAFYQPLFVLMDTDTLGTLSDRDFRAGLAESIKHAAIRDREFFDWHERSAERILGHDPDTLGHLFERNVAIKAAVVAEDEREVSGLRALLNFGHTIGHAVETALARLGEPWRHGECVAVGMVAACEMCVLARRLDRASAERVIALIERLELPTQAPLGQHRDELLQLMHADKKAAAGRIRFVLLDGLGRAALYDDIQPDWVAAGLERTCR